MPHILIQHLTEMIRIQSVRGSKIGDTAGGRLDTTAWTGLIISRFEGVVAVRETRCADGSLTRYQGIVSPVCDQNLPVFSTVRPSITLIMPLTLSWGDIIPG